MYQPPLASLLEAPHRQPASARCGKPNLRHEVTKFVCEIIDASSRTFIAVPHCGCTYAMSMRTRFRGQASRGALCLPNRLPPLQHGRRSGLIAFRSQRQSPHNTASALHAANAHGRRRDGAKCEQPSDGCDRTLNGAVGPGSSGQLNTPKQLRGGLSAACGREQRKEMGAVYASEPGGKQNGGRWNPPPALDEYKSQFVIPPALLS